MAEYESNPEVIQFLTELEQIPWFERIGQIPEGEFHEQIPSWDDWEGPEEPSVAEIHESIQTLYDQITENGSNIELTELWERIHSIVIPLTSSKVPYDDEEDAWYGPNAAVWQAATTAGVVGLCLHTKRPVPDEIQEQWNWFLQGHWPCDRNLETAKIVLY